MKFILPFLLGALSAIEINLFGQMYIGELMLLGLFPIILLKEVKRYDGRFFVRVSLAVAVSAFGYVISDIFRESTFENYSRGWAGFVFLFIDFATLFAIFSMRPRHISTFALGYAVALVLTMDKYGGYSIENWKFGWALPTTIVFLVFSERLRFAARQAACALLAVVHVFLDYRSLGLTLILLSGIALLARFGVRNGRFSARTVVMLAITALFLVPFTVSVYMQSQSSDTTIASRREASNAIRAVGIEMSVRKIIESPIIGWGSWASSPALDSEFAISSSQLSDDAVSIESFMDSGFRPHSQLLQSWYEGGLFGLFFFAFLLLANLRAILILVLRVDYSKIPLLYLFWLLYSIWNLIASPFGGAFRILIAMDLLIIYGANALAGGASLRQQPTCRMNDA